MFFFIGGVQPKTVKLEEQPRMCSSCGLYQARLKRIDHYVSIFFLPILRIKKGTPFLSCDNCGTLSSVSGMGPFPSPEEHLVNSCPTCHKPLESKFRYCPFCGKEL